MTTGIRRLVAGTVLAALIATAVVLACGPFLIQLKPVERVTPPDMTAYARGDIGIVRPRFARRYLVQAYRRITGQSSLASIQRANQPRVDPASTPESPAEIWSKARAAVVDGPGARTGDAPAALETSRRLPEYQTFENCLADAFTTAVATLRGRTARYGPGTPPVLDWIRAQDAVFANCSGTELVLPAPVPSGADPLMSADREYQIASAHFYAMRYVDAARLFRAIGTNTSSPWRPYGLYLSARALIRSATVTEDASTSTITTSYARRPELLEAEKTLQEVLKDPAARPVHASAAGLLDFIAARVRPADRLHELARTLSAGPSVSSQQLTDYEFLMNELASYDSDYEFTRTAAAVGIAREDGLTSWILAMQGSGPAAQRLAVGEWTRTSSTPWLVAALWRTPPEDASAGALLDAAARISPQSAAGQTVLFLRVRLLARLGRVDEARSLLRTAPVAARGAVSPETVNLLKAERFMLAGTFDGLLRNAPRQMIADTGGIPRSLKPLTPVFDEDAGQVFSERLPLARLVEAATSDVLPGRLRLRVATAALARAILLRRWNHVQTLFPVIRGLAPRLVRDLDRLAQAADPDSRQHAALLLLLRTPGIHAHVRGIEDDWWFQRGEAARTFEHTFRRNWWCGFGTVQQISDGSSDSETLALLYPDGKVPFPAFLTDAERAEATRELADLAALGTAPNYLAREVVEWARATPRDPDVAEALALAVEGTRWGCSDAGTSPLSRQAFNALHRLFPGTEWARKTKYWY